MTSAVLQDSEKNIIRNRLKNLLEQIPEFKARPTQRKMIAEVAKALAKAPTESNEESKNLPPQGESFLVIEGPTGTGKSLAYLLPAVVIAKSRGKHLVVSSATVALQEQLANKDLPRLNSNNNEKISYAIAKGRGRYVCNYNLYKYAGIALQTQLALPELANNQDAEDSLSDAQLKSIKKMAEDLQAQRWLGDRDSLTITLDEKLWQRLTNDRHGCLKRQCSYFNDCPFFKARAELEAVDVIIANHDLLLADLSAGGGFILPAPQDTFYCIDEAHNFVPKALQQFAASHSLSGALSWLEKTPQVISHANTLLPQTLLTTKITRTAELIVEYLQNFSAVFSQIPELSLNTGISRDLSRENRSEGLSEERSAILSSERAWEMNLHAKPAQFNAEINQTAAIFRCPQGKWPETLIDLRNHLQQSVTVFLQQLNFLLEQLKAKKNETETVHEKALYERALADLGFLVGRAENMATVWNLLSRDTPIDKAPVAKWIEATLLKNQQVEYFFCAAPTQVADLLTERLWQNAAAAILTSATLRSLGSFNMLLQETGLLAYPKTTTLALPSPFDYARQAQLIIPAMKNVDPTNIKQHTAAIINVLPHYIPREGPNGTLVLFSAWQQMQAVAKNLPEDMRPLILIQGSRSHVALLQAHRQRIESNQASVLFGVASFAEGLDLPGNLCNCLIITKIPFAVPDDPVTATMTEWIEARGGNPFLEKTLPAASIKLIQAVGRLIRSETDRGKIIILDNRLKKKFYGQKLKKALPPFKNVYAEQK